jgi:copper chaperone CopZ
MKNFLFPLFALFIFFSGCSGEKDAPVLKVCTLKIEGMMCEKGCKSTIEGKLAKMEGVEVAKIDFETSVATVKFNSTITSSKAMIEMINAIADGAYSATLMEETDAENVNPSNTNTTNENEASVQDFSFEVPNVSDLFSNIF